MHTNHNLYDEQMATTTTTTSMMNDMKKGPRDALTMCLLGTVGGNYMAEIFFVITID